MSFDSKFRRGLTLLAITLAGCQSTVSSRHSVTDVADGPAVPAATVADMESMPEAPETQTDEPESNVIAVTRHDEPLVFEGEEPALSIAKLIGESEMATEAEGTLDGAPGVETQRVGLGELEALAQSHHPELQQALSRISAARGTAYQAALPYNPLLQYQSDEIGNEGASGLHSVTVTQRVVTANKLGIAQQEQLQVVQKRSAEYEFARLRVLTRVRTAYAAMLVAQQRTRITRSIADLTQRSVATVKSLMDAGEVSRIALLQSQVEARRAELAHQNALAQLDQARRSLAAAVGLGDLPSKSVQDEMPEQLPAQPWSSLVDEVASLSPQITSANAELQRARWALRLACAQVTPDVFGQVGVGYDAATDDTYATVGVSLPLPIRNRNEGNIRAARATISATSANIDRTQLELQQALADAVGRYEVARQTYTQLHSEISPAASEAYDLARKAFESGEADFLQVLTAQRTWFDTRLAAINALEDAKSADAEIRGALTTTVETGPE